MRKNSVRNLLPEIIERINSGEKVDVSRETCRPMDQCVIIDLQKKNENHPSFRVVLKTRTFGHFYNYLRYVF